ncbi:MAG: hypothetical protein DLM52_07285 [Chthoniobacterales bacterium]|nr:MAG: hypothetical protein DLM52_07285 [Chthoniobacterales bacterium]
MKKLTILVASLAITSINTVLGQASPTAASASAAPAARTEVYHVNFSHAAVGKAGALEDALKKASANAPMPGHVLVLRHENGAPWDYASIQHIGTKATVEATGDPRGATMRPMMDWHDDTFVNGPPWADFAKAMGLDDSGKSKGSDDVYILSVYRPNVGQDDALEKFLSEPPSASGDLAVGAMLLQHLEGGAWRFLAISHYKSWQDYATSEATSVGQAAKGSGGWFRLRDLVSFHNDTVSARVAP